MANRVPQAASLQDPTFGVTTYPAPIQTASGALFAQVSATQQLPWFGKLRTRAAAAEAETEMARAELAAAELRVIADVKQAYYRLYILQKSIAITVDERSLLVKISRIAAVKYEAGLVNQQDALLAEVEISNLDNELIALRQQLLSGQARLAKLLHISPETGLRAMEQLPPEQLPKDVERLYETAIRIRPELQSQLAAIQRDRRLIDLARLNYFPDLNAGAGWIDVANHGVATTANGRNAAFVNMTVNVPIYRRRLDAALREAEAATSADSRKYDSLRDRTQEEVKDLFVRVEADQQMLQMFRGSIIPQADQTLQVSIQGYEAGNVDFLQMLDNWQNLLRYQISAYRLEGQLRQDLAELERIVGGSLPATGAPPREPLPAPAGQAR